MVSLPLVKFPPESHQIGDPPEQPFTERDAVLEALSDLEGAHAAGKMSEADYRVEKDKLELRYIELVEEEGQEGSHS